MALPSTPTVQFTNNTYAGEELGGFQAASLLGADSVKRGMWTIQENCKKRDIILVVDDQVVFQTASAPFVDQSTTALQSEVYIDPKKYEFMKQMDWTTLVQSWEARDLKPGSMEDFEGVTALSDFLVSRYIPKIAITNESLYYLGGKDTPAYQAATPYVGLLDKAELSSTNKISLTQASTSQPITGIDATGMVTHSAPAGTFRDGDVVTVLGTTGSQMDMTNAVVSTNPLLNVAPRAVEGQSYFIKGCTPTTFKLYKNYLAVNSRIFASFTGTSGAAQVQFINVSNVIPVLGSLKMQLDYVVKDAPDFKLQVSRNIIDAYIQSAAEKGLNVLGAFETPQQADYLGFKLEAMNYFRANSILGARVKNLYLGVDLLGDGSSLETRDLRQSTLDQVVRMKCSMKSDVAIILPNEVTWLRPSLT